MVNAYRCRTAYRRAHGCASLYVKATVGIQLDFDPSEFAHCSFCFFFQAEDGIRDWSVTGVQTCALPINIRELQNVIERSVMLCETEIFSIDESWLPLPLPATESRCHIELPRRLEAQEKNMIEEALKASHGRVFGPTGAAAKLGIPRSTLESKIKALKIDKNRFKTDPEG